MKNAPYPVLITNPHCSGEVPPEIWESMRKCGEPENALRRRLLSQGDPFTDLLYELPVDTRIVATWSRFVVDLNRARDEAGPNGVIKPADFELKSFYAPGTVLDTEERERRLAAYYDPFHAQIENRLAQGRVAFLLDGHSMTARGPLLGPDAGKPRPALCLGNFGDADGEPVGTEPVTLKPALARALRDKADALIAQAFPAWDKNNRARLNDPFDGGHVLKRYSHPAHPHRVPGLLFEINRALYLDEDKLEPLPGAVERWRDVLKELLDFLLPRLK
jgi:N-formylglutamate amidohydrolase